MTAPLVPVPPDAEAVVSEYNQLIATLAQRCATYAGVIATLQKELAALKSAPPPPPE